MFSFKKIFSNSNSENNNIPNIINEAEVVHMYKQLSKMKEKRPNLEVMQLLRKCFKVNSAILDEVINKYLTNK